LPLLGICGGLLLDVAKEYGIENALVKLMVTAVVAFLVVVAGACWKTKDRTWRTVAVVLVLVPPAALLLRNIETSGAHKLVESFAAVSPFIWMRLLGFIAIGIGVVLLHAVIDRRPLGRGTT
jgi:RsiW-degrading membrane proteinase PrsW (M82 family)